MNQLSMIIDAIHYVNGFKDKTFLIKLGGSILYDDALIESLCEDLKLLKQAGINLIIVHGGSKAINEQLQINNIEAGFVDGLRVTTASAMKIIEMVLCGHVNQLLVRKLNSININAVGLAGTDNQLLQCDYYSQAHGQVGVIKKINTSVLAPYLKQSDLMPIIAPVGVDDKGNAMNINADYAASYLADALRVDKLIYLTDQDGIYDHNNQVLSEINSESLMTLIQQKTVKGGMLVKVNAILDALAGALSEVHILNGQHPHVLLEELFTKTGIGTLCKSKQLLEAVA